MSSDKLTAQQQAADAEANRLAEEMNNLEYELKMAIGAEDFTRAEELKGKLPDVRAAYALAKATATATAQVLSEMAEAEAARNREHQLEVQRAAAREQYDQACATEQEAMAEVRRHWADVEPTLAAARESMRAAVTAESRVAQAQRDAYSARVALGEVEPSMHVSTWYYATAKIQESRLLSDIFHGRGA